MKPYLSYVIKSFKHDGHLHRMWQENWLIPQQWLHDDHRTWHVMINRQTKIVEADGKEWTSRIPGVSFFIPKVWYNVIALLEDQGVRYYCNVASPPYISGNAVTYIDYDLDVVVWPGKEPQILDEHEYEAHKRQYRYSEDVQDKVGKGLAELMLRIDSGGQPFVDALVYEYFDRWARTFHEVPWNGKC